MARVYDNTRTAKQGGGWIERADVNDWITRELPSLRTQAADRLRQHQGRWNTVKNVATVAAAVPFAVAAAPAAASLFAGGGGVSAAGAGGSATGAGAATATAAGLPWLRLSEIGVNAGMNLWGQRQSNRASDRAAQLEAEGQAAYRAALERQHALDEKRFNADEEQRRLDRLAADEERAFTRTTFENKERRRGPYRAVSQGALYSLADIAKIRVPQMGNGRA